MATMTFPASTGIAEDSIVESLSGDPDSTARDELGDAAASAHLSSIIQILVYIGLTPNLAGDIGDVRQRFT